MLASVVITAFLCMFTQIPEKPDPGSEPLQGRLVRAMRSIAPEWVFERATIVEPNTLYRWRLDGHQQYLSLSVREFQDAFDAQTAFRSTVRTLSTSSQNLEGVGDEAVIAGMPGGPTTVYTRVGRRMLQISLLKGVDREHRIAKALARELTDY